MKKTTNRGAPIAKPALFRLYFSQLIVLVLFAACLLVVDTTQSYSFLLGGLISLLPNSYFAYQAFRFSGARSAQHIARALYRGEVAKFVLTAALFAVVFVMVEPLSAGALFSAFVVMMVLNTLLFYRFSKAFDK